MKLLLHACCGPCAIYPLETVLNAGHDVTLIYLNPNIQPRSEWQRRLENAERVADLYKVPLLIDPLYLEDEYMRRQFDGDRCLYCYDTRLGLVSRRAAAGGFEAFSTTLLVSPYQNRDAIVGRGRQLAGASLHFLDDDWRPGYRQGQEAAKALGLYRQQYCGCLPSLELSRYKDKIKARHLAEATPDRAAPPAPDNTLHK